LRTFKRVFSVDLPTERAIELSKESLADKGFTPVEAEAEVAEDFLANRTRVVTVTATS
jgi:hypothetical protein